MPYRNLVGILYVKAQERLTVLRIRDGGAPVPRSGIVPIARGSLQIARFAAELIVFRWAVAFRDQADDNRGTSARSDRFRDRTELPEVRYDVATNA